MNVTRFISLFLQALIVHTYKLKVAELLLSVVVVHLMLLGSGSVLFFQFITTLCLAIVDMRECRLPAKSEGVIFDHLRSYTVT